MTETIAPTKTQFINRIGKKYGRLTVMSYAGRNKGGSNWNCKCDCGSEVVVRGGNLASKITKSCGCYHREVTKRRNRTHGLATTKIYMIWAGIHTRCTNHNEKSYERYGGRGIKVCDRWLKFENFLADMGERPDGMSLDRINNNGDYEPNNCRWATRKEQCRNRRNNRLVEYRGETKLLVEWCELLGLKYKLIYDRLWAGWSIERTLTT